MTQRKLFFTDMDDTLLDRQKRISEENTAAIHEALAAGHRIVLNSGRPIASLRPLLGPLGLEIEGCYAIACNGAVIYDCYTGEVIFRRTIPVEQVREVFRRAKEHGVYCHTYSDTHLLCWKVTEATEYYARTTGIRIHEDPDFLDHMEAEPSKIIAIDLHDHAKLDAYRAAMADWCKGRISMFYSSPTYLEHVPEHVTKGAAMRVLCELLGIPEENTVAAGDQENDIPMLKAAHIGAAVQNAIPSVKACADYIAERDCDHSGVAEVIRKFVL